MIDYMKTPEKGENGLNSCSHLEEYVECWIDLNSVVSSERKHCLTVR